MLSEENEESPDRGVYICPVPDVGKPELTKLTRPYDT
jgi:hypothetical protein